MPYISEERRERLSDGDLSDLNAGDVTYLLTAVVDEYITQKGLSFEALHSALGILESAKLELYRRIQAPYEDTKIEQNGDVYECNMNT